MPTPQQQAALAAIKRGDTAGALAQSTTINRFPSAPAQPTASQIMKPPSANAGASTQSTAGTGQALQQTKSLPPLSTLSTGLTSNPVQPAQNPQTPNPVATQPGQPLQPQQPTTQKPVIPTDNFQVKTPEKTFDTQDAAVNGQVAQTQAQAQTFQDQSKVLEQSSTQDQVGLRDQLVQSAQQTYQAENQNLDALSQKAADALTMKNAAATSESEADKQAAADQYERDTAALEAQRARSQQAYQHQIVQQNVANTQRVLQDESRIAAMGGYGSLTSFRERQQLTLQNDETMNNLVFLKDQADRETTDKVQATSQQYTTSLSKIEADKQQNISGNYDKYVDFVKGVTDDKNKTETEKFEAIKQAAQDYTKNVASIHNDAFTARYNAAEKSAVDARQIYQQHQENLRANIQTSSYTDNAGNVTTVSRDIRTGKIINQDTLNAIGASLAPTMSYDPYTGVGYVLDPVTKQMTSLGSSPNAQNYFTNLPAGVNQVGGAVLPTDDLAKIFGVGKKGWWCGAKANSLTNGPKVGDNWASKISLASLKPGADPNVANQIRAGMQMVLPLGVKTSGAGYGHDTTVLNYNPGPPRIITTVESNHNGEKKDTNDGKGTTTIEHYDLDKLIKSYGSNFGFIPTTFKPEIQKQIDAAKMPYTPGGQQAGNASSTVQDLPGTNPAVIQSLPGADGLLRAFRDISAGNHTIDNYPWASPGQKYEATQHIHEYDPSYNEAIRIANAQNLGPAIATLASLQASESAASASLDNLSSTHSKIPIKSKIASLNGLLQKFEGEMSQPDVAAFRAQAADTMGQVGINITNGNAVNSGLANALEAGLPANVSQEAFDKAIAAIKQTMANKVEGARQTVIAYKNGTDISQKTSKENNNSTKSSAPATIKDKIKQAQDAGYNTQDIITNLQKDSQQKMKIQNSLDAGISPEQILNYLNQ